MSACDRPPECSAGELRYAGRPPRTLFAYDTTCRRDCFSLPAKGGCRPVCEDVAVKAPAGVLINDRSLVLADLETLGDGRALLYRFGFVDEAGGTAPPDWGFVTAGSRSYGSDQIVGTARFVMEALVAHVSLSADLLVLGEVVGEPARALPGRLDVTEAKDERLAARYFLGFESATERPQGEVLGCFDLALGPPRAVGTSEVRALAP